VLSLAIRRFQGTLPLERIGLVQLQPSLEMNCLSTFGIGYSLILEKTALPASAKN
jgi:hypothetical protein